jgi:drug/metabolite transporter (DMT)-like permease
MIGGSCRRPRSGFGGGFGVKSPAMGSPGPAVKAATLALLVGIWGTTWAAVKISLRGFPPFTGVALRFAVAAALLVAIARLMGTPLSAVNRRDRRLRVLHALLSFCASYGIVFWAEQWVPSGLASVLFATFPLFVAVMAHFVLPGERMTASVLAGTVLGFAGIAVIFAEDFDHLGGRSVLVASAVMLMSPLVAAVSTVAVKKWGRGIRPVSFNAVAMIYSAVVMGAAAGVTERHETIVLERWPVLAILYMAVAGTAVTFPLYFWLLEHMQARHLSLIGYGTPVVALFLGAVFLGEALTVRTLSGSALVVIGVAIASHSPRRL